jgi:hypothetical protein
LTAVVSVIRVCGSSSLKAFIGRAQEGPAEAESELLPCVSASTAELFNDGGISRVFGRPRIVEIVAWKNEDAKTEFGTLRDAIRKGAWSAEGSGLTPEDLDDPTRLPELDMPNLSLNKGIKRRNERWFYCTAILGAIMQIGKIMSILGCYLQYRKVSQTKTSSFLRSHCIRCNHCIFISRRFRKGRQTSGQLRIPILHCWNDLALRRHVVLRDNY